MTISQRMVFSRISCLGGVKLMVGVCWLCPDRRMPRICLAPNLPNTDTLSLASGHSVLLKYKTILCRNNTAPFIFSLLWIGEPNELGATFNTPLWRIRGGGYQVIKQGVLYESWGVITVENSLSQRLRWFGSGLVSRQAVLLIMLPS